MILTVTPNTAIDRTYFIKEFSWGKTIRASQSVIGMGGKATDASWILSELGIENIATGFAAGEVGRMMESMLRHRGGYTDFIWVDGETRTNIIIAGEDNRLQTTLVGGGLQISSAHVNQLLDKFTSLLRISSCVIVGGSVPLGLNPEIYTQLIRQALNSKIPVVFDASGPSLRSGLEGRPTIAKPNLDEISDLVGENVSTIEQAYISALALMEKYQSAIVITSRQKGCSGGIARPGLPDPSPSGRDCQHSRRW